MLVCVLWPSMGSLAECSRWAGETVYSARESVLQETWIPCVPSCLLRAMVCPVSSPLHGSQRVVDFSVSSGFFLFVGWTVISMILACGALYFCLHVPSISLLLKCVLTSRYLGTRCFHSYNQVSKNSREACVSMSAYVTKHTFSLTFHLLHWLLS